jgi:hypothetical protein
LDETRLIEKLRLIEALFAGAATEGEALAAERAKQRILNRLKSWEEEDLPVEYRFSMRDMWSRKVFTALLRRYGIRPYRYNGQRHTTVMAKVPKRFVDETIWPEFQEIYTSLQLYLSEVTDRVVSQVIHKDTTDPDIVDNPKALPASMGAVQEAEYSAPSMPTDQSSQEQSSAREKDEPRTSSNKSRRKKRKKRKRR